MIISVTYYFALERMPNSYEAINIKKTQLGRNLFLNNNFECTLEEIDRYTTQYITLEQLIHELYCEKTIPWANSSIAIVCANGTKIIIEKDFLFKNSRTYLDNPSLVLEYLINELSACNIEFARELAKKIDDPKMQEMLDTLIKMMDEKIKNDIPLEMVSLMHIAELLVFNTDNSQHIIEPRLYEYSKIHNIVIAIAKNEKRLKAIKQSYKMVRKKNT